MKCILYSLFLIFLLGILHSCRDSKSTIIEDPLVIQQIDSLISLSRDFTAKGQFDMAMEINAKAEKIALEKLGQKSSSYGSCIFNRGRINDFIGDFVEAEKWYLKSLSIRKSALGRVHQDYALSLNNLGSIYFQMSMYEKAEDFFFRS